MDPRPVSATAYPSSGPLLLAQDTVSRLRDDRPEKIQLPSPRPPTLQGPLRSPPMVLRRALTHTQRIIADMSHSRSSTGHRSSPLFPSLPWVEKWASLGRKTLRWSDEYIRRNVSRVISLIALSAIVGSFVPLYRNDTVSLANTQLLNGVHSTLYQMTVVAAIAVPWSGIIDSLLDHLYVVSLHGNESSERLILLLCLMLPNIYVALYHYIFPSYENGIQIFVIIKYLHEVLYLSPCVIIGIHRDENHFSPTALILLYTLYVCSNVLRSNTLSGDNSQVHLTSDLLYYFSFGPTFIYFIYFWIKVYQESLKGPVKTNDIVNCVLSVSITTLGFSLLVINYATGELYYPQFGSINLSASLLARIFFTLSVTVLPGRLSRYLWRRSDNKLNMKSLFVRYVGHEIR